MERVTGIGGLFIAAHDPKLLTDWYASMLGVDPPPTSYDSAPWQQEAGHTVFAAMDAGAPLFGGGRSWAVNFRVTDLEAMAAQLRERGVQVEIDPETYPNGRFASLVDPEGNGVQLWQVAEPAVGAEG